MSIQLEKQFRLLAEKYYSETHPVTKSRGSLSQAVAMNLTKLTDQDLQTIELRLQHIFDVANKDAANSKTHEGKYTYTFRVLQDGQEKYGLSSSSRNMDNPANRLFDVLKTAPV